MARRVPEVKKVLIIESFKKGLTKIQIMHLVGRSRSTVDHIVNTYLRKAEEIK